MKTYLVHFENAVMAWGKYYNADSESQVMEYACRDLDDDTWILDVEVV